MLRLPPSWNSQDKEHVAMLFEVEWQSYLGKLNVFFSSKLALTKRKVLQNWTQTFFFLTDHYSSGRNHNETSPVPLILHKKKDDLRHIYPHFLRHVNRPIDRWIKIQPKAKHLSTRLRGVTTEFVGFIPWSLVLRSIFLGWILIHRNWSVKIRRTEKFQHF